MTSTLPPPALEHRALTSRLVPALVAGSRIAIDCPAWCVLDHVAENEAHLADVHHTGTATDLVVPSPGPEVDLLLSTYLWADAYSTHVEERAPVVVVDDGAEGFHLSPTAAVEFAGRVEAFAARIRALALVASEVPA